MHRIAYAVKEVAYVGTQVGIGIDDEKIAHSTYHTPIQKKFKMDAFFT